MISSAIAAELPYLRAQAESLMVDTVRVERRIPGAGTVDPDTLQTVSSYEVLYEGVGRVQRRASQSQDASAGDAGVAVDSVEVQIPWTSRPVPRGSRVTVVAVDGLSSAEMGMVATVREDLTKTHATKRTLACEVVSPDERTI